MSGKLPSMKCDVCGKLRPFEDIGIMSHDMSADVGLDEETMFRNVRYCSDNTACRNAAEDFERWRVDLGDDEDRVPLGTETCLETCSSHYTARRSKNGWIVWRHTVIDGEREQYGVMIGTWPYLRHIRASLGARDIAEG